MMPVMPRARRTARGRSPLGLLLLAIGLTCSCGEPARAGSPQEVTFTFAPPDDTHFVQVVETSRELRSPGGTPRIDRTTARAKVRFRRTADGFTITTTPISMKMTRDGKPVSDPALEILDDTVVTYFVAPEGTLLRVEGYEDAARRVRERYPPEVAGAVERLLNPETLVARARAEWEGRIGDFAGRRFAFDRPWDSAATFKLPGGQSLEYFIRTSVVGRAPCPSDSCVEVRFRYDSDPRALGELSARVPDPSGSPAHIRAKLASLSGGGMRVIDPKTMLIYSERITRTMKLEADTSAGAIPLLTREEQRYSIERD